MSRKSFFTHQAAQYPDTAVHLADARWHLPPAGDGYFQIRISRNTLIAILLSLLLHALLLFTLPDFELLETTPARAPEQSINVRLNSVEQPEPEPAPVIPEPVPEPPAVEPEPPTAPKPAPKPKPKPAPVEEDVIAVEKPAPDSFTVPAESAEAPPVAETEPRPATPAAPPAPTDMMSYVNAARERRRLAELDAARENAEATARERGPTSEQLRDAIIKRNLQVQGTNGIFQVLSMNDRSARFSFRGWTNDYSSAKRQTIEVVAESGEDIQRATVRRMIGLIRQYYKGDFNWESHRLNRVVILSARPEDNAGLEDFLIEEFFGAQGMAFPR